MRKTTLRLDEHFFVIHPDLAALFKEIEDKKAELKKPNANRRRLEREIESTQYELDRRLAILENWQKSVNRSRPTDQA